MSRIHGRIAGSASDGTCVCIGIAYAIVMVAILLNWIQSSIRNVPSSPLAARSNTDVLNGNVKAPCADTAAALASDGTSPTKSAAVDTSTIPVLEGGSITMLTQGPHKSDVDNWWQQRIPVCTGISMLDLTCRHVAKLPI